MTGNKFDPYHLSNPAPVRPSGSDHPPRTLDWAGEDKERFKPRLVKEAGSKEKRMAAERAAMLARWSHKNEGTPETLEWANRTEQTSLSRMFMSGAIDVDQLAWAVEIAEAAEIYERDVAVKIVDYQPRIDCSASGKDVLVEGIMRVRREMAYGYWRERIPNPKRAILDMLVGEPVSFSTVAKQYGMHKRKAKRLLIISIDLWPSAMEYAEREADAATIAAAHAGLI